MVVLVLFAISVAGAAGYLLVNTEFAMARYSDQGIEAATVARAGLHRFAAEQLGVMGDSVGYAIGNGVSIVTTRKLAEVDPQSHLYLIRSEGTVDDPRTPGAPARRVIGAYAYFHPQPLEPLGAMVVAADGAYVDDINGNGAEVDGRNQNRPSDCSGGGGRPLPGIVALADAGRVNGGVLRGAPPGSTWSGGFPALYTALGLRWDVLTDPSFPVDFDGVVPSFGSLPADYFPVVRVSGYFNPGSSWSGRGVLIVDGELDTGAGFSWDGIVLAGSVDDVQEGDIRGTLVAGLDGPNSYADVYWRGTIRYYSCYVQAASEALSYLELIPNTEFEAF